MRLKNGEVGLIIDMKVGIKDSIKEPPERQQI